ncbi:lipopolysaccharide assembly protein LapA domain-containing protein [Pseudomonas chlororaphis]|uniref:lipopolysaccharide assembly protein LapA domain-containing protein n=1 Tax=Pseudomonas chlororaphis TaxID=587753 RepID=UPI00353142B6
MRRIQRVILLSIVVVALITTLLFSLENQQLVSLAFVGWSTPQWAISVYILGAFLLGLAVGPLLGSILSRCCKRGLGKHTGHL